MYLCIYTYIYMYAILYHIMFYYITFLYHTSVLDSQFHSDTKTLTVQHFWDARRSPFPRSGAGGVIPRQRVFYKTVFAHVHTYIYICIYIYM